jgi:hypothetical protein
MQERKEKFQFSTTIASVAAFGGKTTETTDPKNQFLGVLWDQSKLKKLCLLKMFVF